MSLTSTLWQQKMKAGGLHFLLSFTIISTYLAIVFFLWYPEPYARLEKVTDAAKIVVGVDLVLGPLLTFFLYRKGKKGLKFDLSMVVLFQLAALSWGVFMTYEQRPVYIAFAEEGFSVVAASELEGKQPVDKSLQARGWGDQKLVFLALPEKAGERFKFLLDNGGSVNNKVELYRPYTEHLEAIFEAGVDIKKRMNDFPDIKQKVGDIVSEYGGLVKDYAFVPVEGRKGFALLVLRRVDGEVMSIMME